MTMCIYVINEADLTSSNNPKTKTNQIDHLEMSLVVRKPVSGFPTRSDTNQAVQPQKMVRVLKFRI